MVRRWAQTIDPHDEVLEHTQGTRGTSRYYLTDRRIKRRWHLDLLFSLIVVGLTALFPAHVLIVVLLALLGLLIVRMRMQIDISALREEGWCLVSFSDIYLRPEKRSVEIESIGLVNHAICLELKRPPRLAGNLSKLIRALDTSCGFSFVVPMSPEYGMVVRNRRLTPLHPLASLFSRSGGQEHNVTLARGGLWKTGLVVIGQTHNPNGLRYFDSAVRGSIPERGLRRLSGKRLAGWIRTHSIARTSPRYYIFGRELSEWTVQLVSELAPEVGASIPGEFISPVRAKQCDYKLGVILNPETLQTGPVVGLADDDLINGVLITGGEWSDRFRAYSLLIPQMLNSGKHVIVLTSNPRALSLTSLTRKSVGLELGKNFILNPVDSEGIPRHDYVPKLKTALEVLSDYQLSSASHFEMALSRAVALNGGTVADISLLQGDDPSNDVVGEAPSRASLAGIEAVRVLHRGNGARAFYGAQTAHMEQFTNIPLTVILVDLNSNELDTLAWDLFMIKLSALQQDQDLVVILDEPLNMLLQLHDRSRGLWTHRLITDLLRRGPLIMSIRNPSELSHVLDLFNSCLAFRLKSSQDIKVMSDMLGLSVVDSLHSKSRISSRESSYLRTMKKDHALLVDADPDTCVPLQLDTPLSLSMPTQAELDARLNQIIGPVERAEYDPQTSILSLVANENVGLAIKILRLLERYEPLTEESLKKFIEMSGDDTTSVEDVLMQLEQASMILRGHEFHSGVSYANYRMTLKGNMALRQATATEGSD